jgi:hypothetical protein
MPKDLREGMAGNGRWITPEMMHERAAAIMKEFDSMPRKVRDKINEGKPVPIANAQTKKFDRYCKAHFK